jgi:ATP-dependent helicase/nuclease subunit B
MIHTFAGTGQPVDNEAHDLTWDSFAAGVEQAIDSSFLPPAVTPDSVIAAELHRRTDRPVRAIFVLGLIEGEFPARIGETFPLTLSERDELRKAEIDLAESQCDAGYDLFRFYNSIGQATERLYLTYARTDVTGGELIRSYLIAEVKQAAPVREIRMGHGDVSSETALTEAASLDELALVTARAFRTGGKLVDVAHRVLSSNSSSWSNTMRAASVERRRLSGIAPDRFGGIIADHDLSEVIREEFGPDRVWSATQINDYGICPFRFFARHGLRLESHGEPVEGFLAQEIGAAYHRVLERVHSELNRKGIAVALDSSRGELVEAEKITGIVERCSGEALDGMVTSGEIRGGSLWEFEKNEISRRILRLLKAEASWNRELPSKPLDLERRFGIGDALALIIHTREGDVRIRGVIDRIDSRSDGIVVIDYKTGASPIGYRDAYEGRNLQLPIYLMAVEQVIRPGRPLASGYYLHINSARKGSELKRGGGPEQAVGPVINRSKEFIGEYTSRARRGRFPVEPNGPCPAYCEYNVMCRIQSLRQTRTHDERTRQAGSLSDSK